MPSSSQSALFGAGDAVISDCGRYRYTLERHWDEALPAVLFVMLNPSTADADQDDATIKKCVKFAKRWGYGALLVGNVFAYRATDPRELRHLTTFDAIGPRNAEHLAALARRTPLIIAAWGADPRAVFAHHQALSAMGNPTLHALKITKGGAPHHPLYLPDDSEPIPFGVEP